MTLKRFFDYLSGAFWTMNILWMVSYATNHSFLTSQVEMIFFFTGCLGFIFIFLFKLLVEMIKESKKKPSEISSERQSWRIKIPPLDYTNVRVAITSEDKGEKK
jgi:hypothetical protein